MLQPVSYSKYILQLTGCLDHVCVLTPKKVYGRSKKKNFVEKGTLATLSSPSGSRLSPFPTPKGKKSSSAWRAETCRPQKKHRVSNKVGRLGNIVATCLSGDSDIDCACVTCILTSDACAECSGLPMHRQTAEVSTSPALAGHAQVCNDHCQL